MYLLLSFSVSNAMTMAFSHLETYKVADLDPVNKENIRVRWSHEWTLPPGGAATCTCRLEWILCIRRDCKLIHYLDYLF